MLRLGGAGYEYPYRDEAAISGLSGLHPPAAAEPHGRSGSLCLLLRGNSRTATTDDLAAFGLSPSSRASRGSAPGQVDALPYFGSPRPARPPVAVGHPALARC